MKLILLIPFSWSLGESNPCFADLKDRRDKQVIVPGFVCNTNIKFHLSVSP